MAFIVHELCSFLWRLCLGLLDMVLSNSLFLSIHSPAQRTPVNRTIIALFSNEILRAVKAFRILLIYSLRGHLVRGRLNYFLLLDSCPWNHILAITMFGSLITFLSGFKTVTFLYLFGS